MGFFIKKSFRAGPIRFNLSKGRIGVSAGVRGLRIGTGPRGPYVAGGKHGVYFRKSLTSAESATESPGSAIVVPATPKPVSTGQGSAVWFVILAGFWFIAGLIQPNTLMLSLAFGFLGVAAALMIWKARRESAMRKFHSKLTELTSSPNQTLVGEIIEFKKGLKNADVAELTADTYERMVESVTENGIDADGLAWLAEVETALGLEPNRVASARLNCYKHLIWHFLGEGDLTKEEEGLLEQIRSSFEIDDSTLAEERDALDQSKRASALADAVPTIDPGIKLQRGEECHHRTSGALMEMKVVRTLTREGRKEKEEDLVPSRTGDIYITSKRVLVVGDGTSAIPHEKILDLEVDWDRKVVIITKDGKQKPIYLSIPDPIYTGKLLEHLSRSTN
jgi:hypothetical protein